MPTITLFKAKKIITMDRNRPEAIHVAVRDGLIHDGSRWTLSFVVAGWRLTSSADGSRRCAGGS
jgi:hypothetical protein